jgi:hypothetical protein
MPLSHPRFLFSPPPLSMRALTELTVYRTTAGQVFIQYAREDGHCYIF